MRMSLVFGTVLAAGLSLTAAVPAGATQGPDNGRITFSRYDPSMGVRFIWTADADGQNPDQLVAGSFSDWAPDGTRIAFDFEDDTGVHIATIGVDGQQREIVFSEPGIQDSPDWSPDGQWIAFNAMDASLPYFSTSIWMVRPDGSDPTRVTSGGFDVEPVFSPDSSQIAFTRIVENGDDEHPQVNSLHVVNIDGTGLREVVPARAGLEHPDWSPDGKWLGFNIAPENGQLADSGSLLAVRPDGKALHVLRARTADLGFFKMAWSPDGKRLLMGCFDTTVERDRLCTSTAGGGGVRPIEMADNSWVNHPAWGPMP
jgi:WD40 repeat protein